MNTRKLFGLQGPVLKVCLLFAGASISGDFLFALESRPKAVQEAVDKKFQEIQNRTASWKYAGLQGFYEFFGKTDDLLVKFIIERQLQNETPRTIYLMELGAGEGQWGWKVAKFLKRNKYNLNHLKFHIVSITGGSELQKGTSDVDKNIQLTQWNGFRIENLEEELEKRGLEIGMNKDSKVALMVSHMTFGHFFDAMGTLQQALSLLEKDGYFHGTNFGFYEFSEKRRYLPRTLSDEFTRKTLAATANVEMIFETNGKKPRASDADVLIRRMNLGPIDLPFDYGEFRRDSNSAQDLDKVTYSRKKGFSDESIEWTSKENENRTIWSAARNIFEDFKGLLEQILGGTSGRNERSEEKEDTQQI